MKIKLVTQEQLDEKLKNVEMTEEELQEIYVNVDTKISTSEIKTKGEIDTKINGAKTELGNKIENTKTDLGSQITELDSKVDVQYLDTNTSLDLLESDIAKKQDKLTAGDNIDITRDTISATDTITTINGKTGVISKADIVALGIPSQDTVYTHPPGTNPHGTTKSDVGLSNVDNVKQMPISGGVLENYREKLVTVSEYGGSINLNLGNVFLHSPTVDITYSITNAVNGQAHSFTLIINRGALNRALTFPPSIKWQGGEIPDMSGTHKTYVLTFVSVNGGTTWLGMFGGEF